MEKIKDSDIKDVFKICSRELKEKNIFDKSYPLSQFKVLAKNKFQEAIIDAVWSKIYKTANKNPPEASLSILNVAIKMIELAEKNGNITLDTLGKGLLISEVNYMANDEELDKEDYASLFELLPKIKKYYDYPNDDVKYFYDSIETAIRNV